MLCTSDFIDDVTFGHSGRDAEKWRLHCHREATTTSSVEIRVQSMMSMNALFVLVLIVSVSGRDLVCEVIDCIALHRQRSNFTAGMSKTLECMMLKATDALCLDCQSPCWHF